MSNVWKSKKVIMVEYPHLPTEIREKVDPAIEWDHNGSYRTLSFEWPFELDEDEDEYDPDRAYAQMEHAIYSYLESEGANISEHDEVMLMIWW